VAITVFPEDVHRPPETWARRAYRNLIYFHEVDRGGHFAAWEQPELFASEIRAAFRPLRKAGTDVARPLEKGGSRETGSAGTSGTGSSGAGQTSPSTPSGTQH